MTAPPRTPPTLRPVMRYGGDYNPEQWDPAVWREDVRLMQDAGVNLVSVGIFSWSTLQPGPDQWRFEWLDEVLELLHEAGIGVDLATPTASPPPWFCLAHPDALYVDERGVRTHQGSRNHYCPSSASYRQACTELAEQLGRRYGQHPAVEMWHIGNEYGPTCHCDSCTEAFRDFLRRRHGSIDQLNRAWGTAFWSQGYQDFDEVLTPVTAPYHHNPSHVLDFRRHSSDLLLRLFTEQRDVLRPLVGGSPITTNFMGFFAGVDARAWAREVDVVADDHYIDPSDPDAPARAALVHDLMRSVGGRPWLMMEQAMGAVNWRPHNVPKTASQRRHDVLRAVGHGADGVLSFQWRQSRHGAERFHSAMLPHAGAESPLHRSVMQTGAELATLEPMVGTHEPAQVALLVDWDSLWAHLDPSLPSERNPLALLEQWYRPLWRRGIRVDLLSSEDDLAGHPVVLAPISHLLSERATESLRAHLAGGGAVVLGPFTAVSDVDGGVTPAPHPAGLADLLGAQVDQWWPLPAQGVEADTAVGRRVVHGWAEQLRVDDARVLVEADHTDLSALVVASPRVDLTLVAADLPDEVLSHLLDEVVARQDVQPDLGPLTGTGGCEVVTRGGVTLVLNPADHPVILTLSGPCTDLLAGQSHTDDLVVPPGGAMALIVPDLLEE